MSGGKLTRHEQGVAQFMSEMMQAASAENGDLDVAKARVHLEKQISERRHQMAALQAQIDVLTSLESALDNWQAVEAPGTRKASNPWSAEALQEAKPFNTFPSSK